MNTGRPAKHPRTPFGKRIHAAREATGLSQVQVAEKLGITQTAYAFWERRPVALRPEQIEKLSEILNIPVESLFSNTSLKNGKDTPKGKTRRVFEEVSCLSRYQQNKIIDVVDAMLLKQKAKA